MDVCEWFCHDAFVRRDSWLLYKQVRRPSQCRHSPLVLAAMRSSVAAAAIRAAGSPGQEPAESPTKSNAGDDAVSEISSVFASVGMQRISRGGKKNQGDVPPSPTPHAEQRPTKTRTGGDGSSGGGQADASTKPQRQTKRRVAAWCYICKCTTDDWTSKAECRPCNNDKESAKRDCIRQDEKAYWEEISKDKEALGAFVRAWVEEVGPSRGFGNARGGFKLANYRETLRKTSQTSKGQEKVMKTKIEFRDAMVAKGMSADWAMEEFKRRRARPDLWDCDTDPDCDLPRVQMHGKTKKESCEINAIDKAVVAETAQLRNPNAQKFGMLLKGFGEDDAAEVSKKRYDLLQAGNFSEITPEANPNLVSDFTPRSFLENLEKDHAKKVEDAAKDGAEAPKDLTTSLERADNNKGKVAFFDAGRFLSDEKAKADKLVLKMQQQLESAS